jgi:hypothetical protein
MQSHLVPVLLRDGARLFDNLGDGDVRLECAEGVSVVPIRGAKNIGSYEPGSHPDQVAGASDETPHPTPPSLRPSPPPIPGARGGGFKSSRNDDDA